MKVHVMYVRYSTRPSNPVRTRRFKDMSSFEKWINDEDQFGVIVVSLTEEED